MKIFLSLMVLLLGSVCWGNTYTFFNTGTATSGASTSIAVTTPSGGPYTSNGVVIVNEGTQEVYFDLSGQLTEAQITAESRAIKLNASESFADSEFRTSKIKVRAKTGSSVYKLWATF